jgi:hypothetical protein
VRGGCDRDWAKAHAPSRRACPQAILYAACWLLFSHRRYRRTEVEAGSPKSELFVGSRVVCTHVRGGGVRLIMENMILKPFSMGPDARLASASRLGSRAGTIASGRNKSHRRGW